MKGPFLEAVAFNVKRHGEELLEQARRLAYQGILEPARSAEATRKLQERAANEVAADMVQELGALIESDNILALRAQLCKGLVARADDMRERATDLSLAAARDTSPDSERCVHASGALSMRLQEAAVRNAIRCAERVADEFLRSGSFVVVR